jgi:hypothetical protein
VRSQLGPKHNLSEDVSVLEASVRLRGIDQPKGFRDRYFELGDLDGAVGPL